MNEELEFQHNLDRRREETMRREAEENPCDDCIKRDAEIAKLKKELSKMVKGISVKIPSETMEQEFSNYYRMGYKKGQEGAKEEITKLKTELAETRKVLYRIRFDTQTASEALHPFLIVSSRIDSIIKSVDSVLDSEDKKNNV